MKISLTWTELNCPVTFPLLNSFLKCPLEKGIFFQNISYPKNYEAQNESIPRGYWLRSIGRLETSWIWARPQIIIWVFKSQNFSVVLFSPLWRIYKTSTHPEKLASSDNAKNSTFAGERLDRQNWESAVKGYTATFTKYTALWRRKTVS